MSQHDDPSRTRHGKEDIAVENTPESDIENIQEGSENQASAGETSADAAAVADELAARLKHAETEAEQYREQALRAQAEMENVRKRAQRDVESARKFAIEKFATELLGVCDSLELGLQAAEASHGDFDKLKEGMDMTHRMLVSSMEKVGVEPIDPAGETFNPEYHEAVSTQPTNDLAPNTVASVMQKGYVLNGRVLRAAMVTVAKPAEES